jgi:hypothetical protein
MVIFFAKLICSVKMICTGNSISAMSVIMLKTPILSQKEDFKGGQQCYERMHMITPTRSRQRCAGPMKRHGSTRPHWKAITSSETKPHIAMMPVKPIPKLRCRSEAVKIMRREMIDSFANTSVAIYSNLFAYSALLKVSQRCVYITVHSLTFW